MSNRNATVTVNTKANTSGIKSATNALNSMDSGLKGTIGNLKQFSGALKGLAIVGIANGIKDVATSLFNTYQIQEKAERSINDAIYSNMKQLNASQEEIDNTVKSYKALASQLQEIGVIGDEVALQGMATMTQMGLQTDKVLELTPLLEDLAVKQYGVNTTQEQFTEISRDVANMINLGKIALQKYGIQVSDVERKQFKAMSSSERLTFVQNKLKNTVAGANEAMLKTPAGKIAHMNNDLGDAAEQAGKQIHNLVNAVAIEALPTVTGFSQSIQELFSIIEGKDTDLKFFNEEDVRLINGISAGYKEIFGNIRDILGTVFDFGDEFGFTTGLLTILNGVVQYLRIITTLAKEAIESAIELGDRVKNVTPFGLATNAIGWVKDATGIGRHATGTTYFEGGLASVNEAGGEIMNLPNGTQIIPHDISQKMVSGGNNVTVNVNIGGNVVGNQEFIDEVGNAISSRVSLALANM
nr:MAG TPA: tape measure protein [Caudoviricetes sp.]